MLYLIQSLFINNFGTLRVFKSIMFRASTAFIVAFLFMLILGKPFIQWLKVKKYGDTAREEGPKSHFDKSGTPTMGGLLIIGAILFATLIAGNFTNKFIVFLFINPNLYTKKNVNAVIINCPAIFFFPDNPFLFRVNFK